MKCFHTQKLHVRLMFEKQFYNVALCISKQCKLDQNVLSFISRTCNSWSFRKKKNQTESISSFPANSLNAKRPFCVKRHTICIQSKCSFCEKRFKHKSPQTPFEHLKSGRARFLPKTRLSVLMPPPRLRGEGEHHSVLPLAAQSPAPRGGVPSTWRCSRCRSPIRACIAPVGWRRSGVLPPVLGSAFQTVIPERKPPKR